jgi:hypothetical protein
VRPPRPLALAALCTVALGPLELGLDLSFATRLPDEGEWSTARAAVEARRREGDLVVAAPRWAEPHARRAFGEALMPTRDVARPDEAGYARAVEVAAAGARDGAFAGWGLLEARAEGRLTVRLWQNPSPEHYVYDLVDEVEAGRVEVSWVLGDGVSIDCAYGEAPTSAVFGQPARAGWRYACVGLPTYSVGVTVIDDLEGRPRRCVLVPPPPAPFREVVVRARQVPAAAAVVGHLGLPYLHEREGGGAPLLVAVRAGDEALGTLAHRDGEGWARFELSPAGRFGEAGLSFHVSGAGAEGRPLCLEARLR